MEKPDYSEEMYRMLTKDSWRVFRIISEFVDGFETMTNLGPSVAIFGSSRMDETNPFYQIAVDVSLEIAKRDFAIITGGGPGLMEAANKGAQLAEGRSCGLCIDIPSEHYHNRFIDRKYRLQFRYFFVRKVMFIRYAQGCVFLPGGFGTMDELFESLTLIQTEKILPFPIFLMGHEYWSGLIDWIKSTVLDMGCISESDLDLITITDDPMTVAETIDQHYKKDQFKQNF